MSLTLNLFDVRRTGIKLPYALPPKQYVEGVGHEWISPFSWAASAGQGMEDSASGGVAAFLQPRQVQVAELHAKRVATLKALVSGKSCSAVLLQYHALLRQIQVEAESERPAEFIDPSLPNFEQDMLQDDKDRHSQFEDAVYLELVRLLYNAGLHLFREGNRIRFSDGTACQTMHQEAAGIFDHLSQWTLPTDDVPNEITPEFLKVLALLCLAGATESELLQRQVSPASQWEALTHLSHNLSYYHGKALSLCRRAKLQMSKAAGVACLPHLENYAAVKQEFYRGLAYDFHTLQPGSRRILGRLRKALKGYEQALVHLGKQMQGLRANVERELDYLMDNVRAKLAEAAEIRSAVAEISPADGADPELAILSGFERSDQLKMPPYYRACDTADVLESASFDSATQSPTLRPSLPAWLAEYAAPAAEAEREAPADTETPAQPTTATPPEGQQEQQIVEESQEGTALQLDLVVPWPDLFHRQLEQRLDSEGAPLISFHELDLVAKVTVNGSRPIAPANQGCAMILVLDTWKDLQEGAPAAGKIASVRDVAKLLLRVVGLKETDWVGVAGYVNGKLKAYPLTPCSAAGQEAVARQISSLSPVGNHKGSRGSSVVRCLTEALKNVQTSGAQYSSLELVVCSDGHDSTSDTHYYNWGHLHGLFKAHRNAEQIINRAIRVHSFSLGGSADKYLLKAISKGMRGEYSRADLNLDGLATFRLWLLRRIADLKSKVASRCVLSVQCAPGVTLKQVGRYDLVFDPTFVHPHANDPDSGEIALADFSDGHCCNIVITLGVPEGHVGFDLTQLAEITLGYTNSATGTAERLSRDVQLGSPQRVITREGFSWLPQLYCSRVTGVVNLSGIGGGTTTLCSGDLVDAMDCIDTKVGRLHGFLPDGTRFSFLERTSALITSLEPAERLSSVTLRKGAVFVTTGEGAECEVRVLDPMYSITIESHSFVKVAIEPKGLITVNCMHGHAYITTERNDERSVLEVMSLRQTQMTDTLSPITPWTLEESCYEEWLSPGTPSAEFLATLLATGVQICRAVCAEWVAKASQWLQKGSWDRVTESKANRRCREFLIRFWLRESKHFLTNNMSGLCPKTEHIRKVVDRGIFLGFTQDRTARRNRDSLFDLYTSAVSLMRERSQGPCDAFDTPLQRSLFAECADAKDKEERDREEAEATRQRQLRNHEASRRERILRALFPLADLDGVGVVYATTVQQAILTVAEVKDPVIAEVCARACSRWGTIIAAVAKSKRNREVATCAPGVDHDAAGGLAMNEDDFVKLWVSLTGECDTPWFNLFAEQLHGIIEEVCILNESTRRSRAVFSLFRKWDSEGRGSIPYRDLLEAVEEAHGSCPRIHLDLGRLNCGLLVPPPPPVKAPSDGQMLKEFASMKDGVRGGDNATIVSGDVSETTASVHATTAVQQLTPQQMLEQALQGPPPAELEGDRPVTLRMLHFGLAAFYANYTERAFHQAIERLAHIVQQKKRAHNSIVRCVKSLQREQETEHLQQWDLRHVFDGISSKELAKLVRLPPEETPEYVQTASAPICILCGIVASKRALVTSDEIALDYWSGLRGKLQKDADGFIDFLRNFPVLSVTYRQVLRALCFLHSPDYDSCRLMALCPPLAQMCEWVKVILKLIFLEHGWDFSNHLKVLHQGSALRDEEGGLSAERLAQKPGLLGDYTVVDKPHMQMKFNKTFEGIIEADDPCRRACSRFSMYSDLSDVVASDSTTLAACKRQVQSPAERVSLPDRRLNSPLLRTMPVASLTCADNLPPHFVPRVDFDDRPNAVCTQLQKEAFLAGQAGRSPGPPQAYGRTYTPQPPRPQSAPVSGRPKGAAATYSKQSAASRGFCSASPSTMGQTPTPPCTPQLAYATQTEVGRFLESHQMHELAEHLARQGFDDMDDLRELVASDAAMTQHVSKAGHRMKLKRLVSCE